MSTLTISDGTELFYKRHGYPDGQTIVLIHGLGGNAGTWQPLMEYHEDNYDFIAYDYRGHGHTDSTDTDEYSIDMFVEELRVLLEELDVTDPVLVGHSFGGIIATEYALTHPDSVAGVVLADGRTDLGDEMLGMRLMIKFYPQLQSVKDIIGEDRFETAMNTVQRVLYDYDPDSEDDEPDGDIPGMDYGDDQDLSVDPAVLQKGYAAGDEYVGAEPTDIAQPVLYAYGEGSATQLFKQTGERLSRATTNVETVQIDDAGHMFIYHGHEQFGDALAAFVDELDEPEIASKQ